MSWAYGFVLAIQADSQAQRQLAEMAQQLEAAQQQVARLEGRMMQQQQQFVIVRTARMVILPRTHSLMNMCSISCCLYAAYMNGLMHIFSLYG